MVGKYEHINTRTGYPMINRIKTGLINSLFFTETDFYFGNETDFESKSAWVSFMKQDKIRQVFVDKSEDQSEQDQVLTSILDYDFFYKHGKYKFTFRAPYNLNYHQYLLQWSNKPSRVFIGDVNKNIHATKYGNYVRGFDVELFTVEKKNFAFGNNSANTVIKLVLSSVKEYNENGLTTQMEWNPARMNLIHVTISNVSGSGNVLKLSVHDSVYGLPIEGLMASDFIVSDNENPLTITNIRQRECDTYDITFSGALSFGTIAVDSDNYYSGNPVGYYVDENTVIFNNWEFETRQLFRVDVRYAGSLTLYGGLVLTDFSMEDDSEGTVTIISVTEISAGRYEFETTEQLTEGTISADDGTILGTGVYEVAIEVGFFDIVNTSTYTFGAIIKTKLTQVIIEGINDGIGVVDDYHGVIAVTNISEPSAGNYFFTLDKAKTKFMVVLSWGIYFGSKEINHILSYYLYNGGGANTTDFVEGIGGVALGFNIMNPTRCTTTVITDPYLEGNAQKIKQDSGTLPVGIVTNLVYFRFGRTYKVRIKYRTTNAGSGADRFTTLQLYGFGNVYIHESIEPNTGYWSLYESESFVPSGEPYLQCQLVFNRINMELIIDTWEIIEV